MATGMNLQEHTYDALVSYCLLLNFDIMYYITCLA